jgi:hypothetical protein
MGKISWRWLVVFLLLMAFFIRSHRIIALPPFNDESHHIRRAEVVWTFSDPDLSFTPGKLLTYYWFGIFGADRLDAIFITRMATALASLLGLASVYAAGKRLFGAWAGLLGLYLIAFSPFMVFFDRLALADPLTAALGMVTIWASLKLLDHPQEPLWGFVAGLLATLTILAKLLGLPFALIPIWAGWMLAGGSLREKWMRYRLTLITCYTTIGVILTPFFLRIVYKELTGDRVSVVDPHLVNTQSPLETLLNNLDHLWEANRIFNGVSLLMIVLFAAAVAIRLKPRPVIFAIGCVLLPWGMSVGVGGVLSTRYLQLGILPLFVLIAGTLVIVIDHVASFVRARYASPLHTPTRNWMIGWGIATVWIVFFAQPFILNLWNDPRQNEYPSRDRWEYFTNFTAGYGLMDAAKIMPTLEPSATSGRIPVIGIVGSCHQIRLYLDEFGPVYLECPAFGWQGEYMDAIAAYVDQRVREESVLYMLVEPELPFTDLSKLHVRHVVMGRFSRPFDGMTVELWQVFEGTGT